MVKRLWAVLINPVLRFLLSLRYKVRVKGKKELAAYLFEKPGGILFLANHPAEIDPLILLSHLWFPFKPHPVAIDYLFRMPIVGFLLKLTDALPIPNFDTGNNSYKRKKMDAAFQGIFQALDNKENVLIYPAGGLKSGPEEVIGGASGVHAILQAKPQANVVLIRTTGLWGSSFSKAPTGKTPDLFAAFNHGFKVVLKNLIFFAPRRHVLVELAPAPPDFPWKAGRRELNRYLENWYNAYGPDPLNLVSFSHLRAEFPHMIEMSQEEEISLEQVPEDVKKQVIAEIAKLTSVPQEEITANSHLAHDLGLDSLDLSQLAVSLKDQFGIESVNSAELTTVKSVIAYAARIKTEKGEGEEEKPMNIWESETNRPSACYPDGETIPEIFLNTCERMDGYIACADQIAGIMDYRRLKLGIFLLADAIRKMSGERIGIMMPASVGVNAIVIATMFAKKIPVMVNWTLGERNLTSVIEQSGIQTTISSWQFLEHLDNVELDGIDDTFVFVEDLRKNFSISSKLKALYYSRKKNKSILKAFEIDKCHGEDMAAILFTSGTESYPKGVPLSHQNIIENQRGAYRLAKLRSDDVLLGSLPPFHSFGFSVTGLLPLLAGLRVAYTPNPTDGKRLAAAIERWKVTLLCLAPTFLKNLLRVSSEKQLRSLRLVVSGAEKAASELYERLEELNSKASMIEGYGITECAPILTLNPPDKPAHGVGVPLPQVELKIVHPETFAPLPLGERGLILARGPNVFNGYLDPKIASPFIKVEEKQWYQTGDLGSLDANNYLTLSGRLKRFAKIGGEMVSLTAIEETLLQKAQSKGWKLDPEKPSLAVCSHEVEGKKSEMHLFTIFDTTPEEVNQALRESGMSNVIKIRTVRKLPYIPLLGTGKIDYRRLTSMLEENSSNSSKAKGTS
jgi:acyl carrier protein